MYGRRVMFTKNTMFGGHLLISAQFRENLEEFVLKERQLS
jgi:hypothetical protein